MTWKTWHRWNLKKCYQDENKMPPISEIKRNARLGISPDESAFLLCDSKTTRFYSGATIARAQASSNVLKEESKYEIIFPDMHVRIVFR